MTPTKSVAASCAVIVGLLVLGTASSIALSKLAVVPSTYGISIINLDGRGLMGTVVLARRDNNNAHGFDVLSIYVKDTSDARGASLDILPFFENRDRNTEEKFQLTAGGGADCTLRDFRLVRKPSGDAEVIVAQREYGSSYIDPNRVTFEYFELKRNAARDVGRPQYYFESVATQQTNQKYCDVGEALQKELGLGRDGPRQAH